MEVTAKIANNLIRNVRTEETVTVSSLWQDSACVIQFMRRFGCPVCRMGARDLQHLKPRFDAANVRLIGVGHEDVGANEFLELGLWNGELFIDQHRKTYCDLSFKRLNILSMLRALITAETRESLNRAASEGITGNMAGDGLQIGGTIVVDKGGKLLLNFKQNSPADTVPLDRILHVLGIGPKSPVTISSTSTTK